MSQSAEAADSLVRYGIQFTEASLRILAGASERVFALLLHLIKDAQTSKAGILSIKKLEQHGQPLQVFSLRESDLEVFKEHAKRLSIKCSMVIKGTGDMTDNVEMLIPVDYIGRVNHIMQNILCYPPPFREEQAPNKSARVGQSERTSSGRGDGLNCEDRQSVRDALNMVSADESGEPAPVRRSTPAPQHRVYGN